MKSLKSISRANPKFQALRKFLPRNSACPKKTSRPCGSGGIVGVHKILFGFPHQTVRLKHESIVREAFGNGILFAIQNLQEKPRGFYTMENLLLPYFKLQDSVEDIINTDHKLLDQV